MEYLWNELTVFTIFLNGKIGWIFNTWVFLIMYGSLLFLEPFASVPLLRKVITAKNLEALSLETVVINWAIGSMMVLYGIWKIQPEIMLAGFLGGVIQLAILCVGLTRGAKFVWDGHKSE